MTTITKYYDTRNTYKAIRRWVWKHRHKTRTHKQGLEIMKSIREAARRSRKNKTLKSTWVTWDGHEGTVWYQPCPKNTYTIEVKIFTSDITRAPGKMSKKWRNIKIV